MDGFTVGYLIVKFPIGCSCLYIAIGGILPNLPFTNALLKSKIAKWIYPETAAVCFCICFNSRSEVIPR